MSRPSRVVFVSGTGTEVGKTWVTAGVVRELRSRGLSVCARKPAQSFEAGDDPESTDAGVLAGASGESAEVVCPPHRWYPVAMAPPMAATALGRPSFGIADLAGEVAASWPDPRVSVGFVEGAGGLAAPHASDGDALVLASELGADAILLVADAGLGTINPVRLCIRALAGAGGPPAVVFLNRFDAFDDLHVANRDWLVGRDGFVVCTDLPALADRVFAER